MKYLLIFLAILSLCPSAQAECSAERGNCCKESDECTVIFYPAFCAIVSVNKSDAKRLSDAAPASFCQAEIIKKLSDDSKAAKSICYKGQCELDQDNG